MGYKYWKGGSNGAVDDTDGDWSVAANWEPSGVPASTDMVVFGEQAGICNNDSALKHTVGKHWNCYTGMAQSAVQLKGLIVTEGFTGLIGVNAEGTEDPLLIGISGELWFMSNETLNIKSDYGTSAIPLTFHKSATGLLKIDTDLSTNKWTEIHCQNAGTLEIVDACFFDKIHCGGDFTGIVKIGIDITGTPVLEVYGGTVYCGSSLGTVKNAGVIEFGSIDIENVEYDAINVDDLLQIAGTFIWRHKGQLKALQLSGGVIRAVGDGLKDLGNNVAKDIKVYGGKLDLSEVQNIITQNGNSTIVVRGEGQVIMPQNVEVVFTELLV